MWTTLSLLFLAFVVGTVIRRALQNKHTLPLPPSPQRHWLLGNVFDIPSIEPWKGFRDLCTNYGPLVFLHIPTQPMLIVGTVEAALDLLDKRSQIYSDRTMSVMDELIGWDFSLGHMSYGQKWRDHRRIFHQHFNQTAVKSYQSVELNEVRLLLGRLVETPAETAQHIRLAFASIVFRVLYGRQITTLDDEYLYLAQKGAESLIIQRVPGAFWVEFFPPLRYLPSWIPGLKFRQVANFYRPILKRMINLPFDETIQAVAEGTAPHSVASSLIGQLPSPPTINGDVSEEELRARNVLGIAFAAGADTTVAACQAVLTAMVMFPEVLHKAQAELDAVVGPDRLPNFSDFDQLVYVRAIAMEALRWMPVSPFGMPHTSSTDDEYMGYRIPKGTIILANLWAMLRNPDEYPEPERFNPDRFIKNGKINPDVRDPATIAFGFGRRICPGRHLGEGSLFLFIASVLHSFDIRSGKDEDGEPIEITDDVTTGLIAGPLCIPNGLKPRSASAERLIHLSLAEM